MKFTFHLNQKYQIYILLMNRHSLSLTSKVKFRAHSIFENGTRALLFWLSIATLLFVVSVSLVLNSGFCNSADFESAGLVEFNPHPQCSTLTPDATPAASAAKKQTPISKTRNQKREQPLWKMKATPCTKN